MILNGQVVGIFVAWALVQPTKALDNGLGLTPPLGYNAYNHLGCCANETTLRQQGQALIDTGLKDLGFVYVNVDCGWMGGRHSNGTLFESQTKFPSGMRALADWLHDRGLKLGVYSDRGENDFSGRGLGMKGHEVQDANWMASVGVDYLKVDDMSGEPKTEAGAYTDYAKIRDALNATGRPIFFSTCGHSGDPDGHPAAYPWVGPKCGELANACRIASDVRFWGIGTFGTNKAVNVMAEYGGNWSHAGSWPDPDLIFGHRAVGPAGVNSVCKGAGVLEYCTGSFCDPVATHSATQYALWAIMGAPLLLSFDVAAVDPMELTTIYANPEIIAINQDADSDGRGTPGGRRVAGSDFPEKMPERDAKACASRDFHINRTGVEVMGLHCVNASSPAQCVTECCSTKKCTTWQWNPHHSSSGKSIDHCTSDGRWGPCWIGSGVAGRSNMTAWIGGSRSVQPSPPASTRGTNIWVRNLFNGSIAMLFINNNPSPIAMNCSTDCISAARLMTGRTYAIRDVIARTDLTPVTLGSSGLSTPIPVPGNAGSVLLKLTLIR